MAGAPTDSDRRRFLRLAGAAPLGLLPAGSRVPASAKRINQGDAQRSPEAAIVTLFLCGDVMTGRGIDQVLPYPGDPRLQESVVRSARDYVALAEAAHGPIPKPVDFSYIWGAALDAFARARPAARIVNLETSVTTSEDLVPKGINYRMNPQNLPCLSAAQIDCCGLANNHVLDWGEAGLRETLTTLAAAGLKSAGAGLDAAAAAAPAIIETGGRGRVIVFAMGSTTSGIPPDWAATQARPGVDLLADLSAESARHIAERVRQVKRPGDIVVASIHWGGNWGYRIPRAQRAFARRLIDGGGVDLVHGHSSHHVKAIEVYNGKLILYGCGDFVTDYEGIRGYEGYRDDLVLMYFPTVERGSGKLSRLDMTPLRIRSFRLQRASERDVRWLRDTLTREGAAFATAARLEDDGTLSLEWDAAARR